MKPLQNEQFLASLEAGTGNTQKIQKKSKEVKHFRTDCKDLFLTQLEELLKQGVKWSDIKVTSSKMHYREIHHAFWI